MKRLSYKDKTIILRVSITETHLKKLDEMSGDNQRSALIRKLIDQEWERRHPAEKGQKKECEEVK